MEEGFQDREDDFSDREDDFPDREDCVSDRDNDFSDSDDDLPDGSVGIVAGEYLLSKEYYFQWTSEDFLEEWEIGQGHLESPSFPFLGEDYQVVCSKTDVSNVVLIAILRKNNYFVDNFNVDLQIRTDCNVISETHMVTTRKTPVIPAFYVNVSKFFSLDRPILTFQFLLRKFSGSEEVAAFTMLTEKVQKDFKNLLSKGENPDVKLMVDGKEFLAHKTMLCARSPVFKAMFSHDTVEKKEGIVVIDGCDPDSFEDFLTHVYTGGISHINTKNVFSIYTTSDRYLVFDLKSACVSFMKKKVSMEFFWDIADLALRHDDKELVELSKNFFRQNFRKIYQTENWSTFLEENPKDAVEVFLKALLNRR